MNILSGGNLPPPVEKNDGTSKTITEYSMNDEGKKVKVCKFLLVCLFLSLIFRSEEKYKYKFSVIAVWRVGSCRVYLLIGTFTLI